MPGNEPPILPRDEWDKYADEDATDNLPRYRRGGRGSEPPIGSRLERLDPAVVDQVPIAVFNRLIDVVNALLDTTALTDDHRVTVQLDADGWAIQLGDGGDD